jgi:hypothetical protein
MAGVPLLPKDSGVLGKGVLGDMILGADYTPISDLTTPYPAHPVVPINIYTTTMVLCGMVDDYEYFRHIENLYDFDTFEITINRAKSNVAQLIPDRFISFTSDGREFFGIIDAKNVELDAEGKASKTVRIEGRGLESAFSRPCVYGISTGTGTNDTATTVIPTLTFTFAASTTVTASASCLATAKVGHYIYNSTNDDATKATEITAISVDGLTITLAAAYGGTTGAGKAATLLGEEGETALRRYVDSECISSAHTACNLTGLALAIDGKRGGIVVRQVRLDLLSDILFGISKEAEVFFRLVHGTGLNFTFTVYTGTDVSAYVSITPDLDNATNLKYYESLLDSKNALIMCGSGDGAARLFTYVHSGTTEPSSWARRCKSVDAQDLTTEAELSAKGYELLATLGESLTLEVEYVPNPPFVLGTHFDCGDIIRVIFPEEVTKDARITSVTREWDVDSGKIVMLGIGKEAPDLKSIMKLQRMTNTAPNRK